MMQSSLSSGGILMEYLAHHSSVTAGRYHQDDITASYFAPQTELMTRESGAPPMQRLTTKFQGNSPLSGA